MRSLLSTAVILLSMLASTAYGCDEACLKEKAEQAEGVKFPSYLTWKYCDDTRMEFMSSAMRSINKYSKKHIDTRYKGPLKNIKQFVASRKEWLQECDNYLQLTGKGRIFEDEETTKTVFNSIDQVTDELAGLIAGVTYSSSTGGQQGGELQQKFTSLVTTVEKHKTLMHLKGRYVYR